MSRLIVITGLNLNTREKAVLKAVENQKMGRNASKIAREAGIPRTTALYILEKLAKWKLVKKIRLEKHWIWLCGRTLK